MKDCLKILISALLFGLTLSESVCLAQSSVLEFIDGKVFKFSTKGHAKAKGAVLTVTYPASWTAKEGDRPNIVQKFISEKGKGEATIMIITKELPPEVVINEFEKKALLSPDGLKEMIPQNAKYINGKATKIEAEPAGIVEYSMRAERVGQEMEAHFISLIFLQGRTLVTVQCMVGALKTEESQLPLRFAAFQPLFQQVMNSIIFDDKWK